MHATWIPDAKLARVSLPAIAALALVWPRTISLSLGATWRTNWLQTIATCPAAETLDLAIARAGVVAVHVVARAAQNVALFAVVVALTGNPVAVFQCCNIRLVLVEGPLVFDRQPAVHRVLNN